MRSRRRPRGYPRASAIFQPVAPKSCFDRFAKLKISYRPGRLFPIQKNQLATAARDNKTVNPFFYRVALLVGLMAVVSALDVWRNGARAVRFREYGFILVAGAAGAAFGFVNDLITSSISPEYFIFGKGLKDGTDLRLRAGLFGVREGFSAGVIGGAICLFGTRRKTAQPPAKIVYFLRMLWMPVAGAIVCAFLFPLSFSHFDPARLTPQLEGLVSAGRISRFREVWWIHVGVYAGMILGLAALIRRALKARSAAP
jgi:hypothetical protein